MNTQNLKFRVWHKKSKRYCEVYNLVFGGKEATLFGVRANFPKGFDEQALLEDVTVEQFTGLKDKKNDKEIYEGDIVRYRNDLLYIVVWSEVNAMWYLLQIRGKKIPYTGGINGQDIWRCEVVGNIHENPELLSYGGA